MSTFAPSYYYMSFHIIMNTTSVISQDYESAAEIEMLKLGFYRA